MTAALQQKESGYIFEILPDGSTSVRRADMENPEAREGLRLLLSISSGVEVSRREVAYTLDRIPPKCEFFVIKVRYHEKDLILQVRQTDREPGKDSGDNAIITNICWRTTTH